jgi:hypothetical protein
MAKRKSLPRESDSAKWNELWSSLISAKRGGHRSKVLEAKKKISSFNRKLGIR